MKELQIAIAGAGYVGLASALTLAHIGHRVRVLDRDAERIARLRGASDPLGEPYFSDLLKATKILFTTEADVAYRGADLVVVAVGTPSTASGSVDLRQLDEASAALAEAARSCTVLVRSTVPVGTCDRLQAGILREFDVVSNPEFLREGSAIADSLRPARIVAGGRTEAEGFVRELYAPVVHQRYGPVGPLTPVGSVPLFWSDRRTAELAKYASNAFLVTKLSFANEIANLATAVGADGRRVLEIVATDPRIGPSFLRPGLGWGGSCFPKDARALLDFALASGYELSMLRSVLDQNNAQLLRAFHSLIRELSAIDRPRIGLLGLAFKSGTADCRESPAIALAGLLVERGHEVRAYDPAVTATDLSALVLCGSAREAALGADALVIATEWPEFAALDFVEMRKTMRGDLVFDGRCIIDPGTVIRAGLRYRGVCTPALD